MKKMMLSLALASAFAFVGCSNDDDENGQTCRTCEVLTISTELCDNGDGTVTLTALGETETLSEEDLEGLTPEEYIEQFCEVSDLFGNE